MRWRPRPPRRPMRIGLKARLLLACGIAVILIAVTLIQVDSRLRPIIVRFAAAELDNRVSGTVNEVCQDMMASGRLTYSDLVDVIYDRNGQVLGLRADTDAINTLKMELGREVSEVLDGMDRQVVSVPIGSVVNIPLLSGLGPCISVEILHMGQVSVAVQSSFQEVGINQTLHTIDVVVSVDVLLMMPGGTCVQQESSTIPVTENILLGDVPESYSDFGRFDQASDSNAAEEE